MKKKLQQKKYGDRSRDWVSGAPHIKKTKMHMYIKLRRRINLLININRPRDLKYEGKSYTWVISSLHPLEMGEEGVNPENL